MNAELAVQVLDLEPIKYKLVVDRRWARERAENAEFHYKCFLTLIIRHPGESIVPLGDIDAFWHQHILDTRKYAADCELIFGRFLHHYPYFGLRGDQDAQDLKTATTRTAELFLTEFDLKLDKAHQCAACEPGGTCGPDHCEEELLPSTRLRPRFAPADRAA